MKIGREEVEHVAQLSRLALTEPELARMQQDLTEILTDTMSLLLAFAVAANSDMLKSSVISPFICGGSGFAFFFVAVCFLCLIVGSI